MAAAEATVPQQLQDMGRGDFDDGDVGSLLLPRVVTGPDENGVRKAIEYRFDDEGNKFQVITIISPVCKLETGSISRSHIEHHWMPNPADPMNGSTGSRLTNVSTERILPERLFSSGNKAEESTAPGVSLVRSSKGDNVLMECMICCNKGHHWTAKCPSRSLYAADKLPTADDPSTKRAYPPSFMMGTTDRFADRVKKIINDNRCVQVTNLSEGSRESDLFQLFSMFGVVTCVYMPVDDNGSGSGVGYVKFAQRHKAEAAIRRLNGWIYDDLTLQVGWAA